MKSFDCDAKAWGFVHRLPVSAINRILICLCFALAALLWLGNASAASGGATALELDDQHPVVEVWSHITSLPDPGRSLGLDQAMGMTDAFTTPSTAARTLGLQDGVVWLRLAFALKDGADRFWVLDIDYPLLNRVDMFLVSGGRMVQHQVMGNLLAPNDRPVRARALSTGLMLDGAKPYELFLRIDHVGPVILPITLSKPAAFLPRALGEQMLQGLLLGLAVCLWAYSLGQWLALRESRYLKYLILVAGGTLFNLQHFGVGGQFLWPGNNWIELHISGISALVASAGTYLFVEDVLSGGDMGPGLSRLMKIGAGLTMLSALVFALDLISVSQVTFIITTLGLASLVLGVPGAFRRARRGDSIGYYFLVAWAASFATAWILSQVIKGHLAANFWSQHSYQFGTTLDILIFMRVLGLQTQALARAARLAKLERDQLHSMAYTDPLTGLSNRRALRPTIATAIARRGPGEMVAVFMLDLDGFKKVNDEHGHDIGDELLIAVARRLEAGLRNTDLVSRLGGDEFLVLSRGLANPAQAQERADKLIKTISEPYAIAGLELQVGLTIGYALAPVDGLDSQILCKKADAAMYAAKTEGKGRARPAPRDAAFSPMSVSELHGA